MEHSPNTWATATHMGDLARVLGSWLWSVLHLVPMVIWESELVDEGSIVLILSLYLLNTNFQNNSSK